MAYFTEQLQTLQQQIARKKLLKKMLAELSAQRQELLEKVERLESLKLEEQIHVDRLEGHSLAALFYAFIGKKEDMLDKERREAYAAAVQYDAAVNELTAVEMRIQQYEQELTPLHDCQDRYASLLREKAAAIKASGTPEAEQILQMEERIAVFENQGKELEEAIIEGQKAQRMASTILASLNSAENWGTLDLLGGGLVSSVAKHKRLDGAQWQVKQLQKQLDCFRTELADIKIHADMKVNMDGALRFTDYFFDGLFADWAVMDHISQSQTQVQKTYKQISDALSKLNQLLVEMKRQQAYTKNQLDALVEKAEM